MSTILIKPINGTLQIENVFFERLDVYLIVKYGINSYLTGISAHSKKYQNWDDIFKFQYDKDENLIIFECWDYNVLNIQRDSNYIGQGELILKNVEFSTEKKAFCWVKIHDDKKNELGDILIEILLQNDEYPQLEKEIEQHFQTNPNNQIFKQQSHEQQYVSLDETQKQFQQKFQQKQSSQYPNFTAYNDGKDDPSPINQNINTIRCYDVKQQNEDIQINSQNQSQTDSNQTYFQPQVIQKVQVLPQQIQQLTSSGQQQQQIQQQQILQQQQIQQQQIQQQQIQLQQIPQQIPLQILQQIPQQIQQQPIQQQGQQIIIAKKQVQNFNPPMQHNSSQGQLVSQQQQQQHILTQHQGLQRFPQQYQIGAYQQQQQVIQPQIVRHQSQFNFQSPQTYQNQRRPTAHPNVVYR